MGQVNVQIGGRSYSVACVDGDEPRVTRLAHYIDRKADDLTGTLGQLSEPRLLFMAGLMIADELFELREKGAAAAPAHAAPAHAEPAATAEPTAPALEALASRIDALAESLEKQA